VGGQAGEPRVAHQNNRMAPEQHAWAAWRGWAHDDGCSRVIGRERGGAIQGHPT